MTDIEKVIKGLQIERECVSRDCDRNCGKCDLVQDRDWLLSVYDDALELLKEQPEIVLCRDCYFGKPLNNSPYILCNHSYHKGHSFVGDYYCASGIRSVK